ncbi:MAG TPA: hypothetical protein VGD98_23275 [Ktedonobacteraceae bacterium]
MPGQRNERAGYTPGKQGGQAEPERVASVTGESAAWSASPRHTGHAQARVHSETYRPRRQAEQKSAGGSLSSEGER